MSVDRLVKLLSTAFKRDQGSNNYKLLKIISDGFDEIEEQLNSIRLTHYIETAYGRSLDYLASLFNLSREDRNDEELRYRIILERMKQLSCGTKQDILNIFTFFGFETVEIVEPPEVANATFKILLDADEISNFKETTYIGYGYGGYGTVPYGGTEISISNTLLDILDAVKPAGVKAILKYRYYTTLTTLSSTKSSIKLLTNLQSTTVCNASNIFQMIQKCSTETKCYAEVKLGYGYFGYGEYGYGGVW